MFKKPYKNLNQITVSKSALKHNYYYFQNQLENQLVAPVLKSNAYGHGIQLVGKYVDQEIKPPFICVDSLFEAYQLQKKRIKTPILIIGYTFPENFITRKKLPFSIPVFDLETLKILNEHQPGISVHIKIDTGMNRLGLQLKQIPEFIRAAKKMENVNFEGIYSHFSQADDVKDRSYTNHQVNVFKEALKIFKHNGFNFKWKHMSATAGTTLVEEDVFNLVRIGLGFYGYTSISRGYRVGLKQSKDLHPALKLETHIIQVKKIQKGDQVSYDGTYIAPNKRTIAILPIGYNDGVDRKLSNRGFFTIENTACPIIGRVCMNLTIVDVSEIKEPHTGQKAVFISNDLKTKSNLYKHSKLANTAIYTILTGLAESTKRELVE
ncbi:alanine racemase [Patescibacteria group bacterium]